MLGVAVDAVGLFHLFAGFGPGLGGAGVHIEAGEVAGGDGDADAVAGVEDLAGGPAIDADLLDLAGRERLGFFTALAVAQALHALGDEHAATIGIDIAKTDGEVGIGGAGGDEDLREDAAGDFDGLVEHVAGENEHVIAALDLPLVHGAAVDGEIVPADGGARVGGIKRVFVRCRACLGGFERELFVSGEIQSRFLRWDGPVIGIAPFIAWSAGRAGITHDVVGDGGLFIDAVVRAVEIMSEPAQRVVGLRDAGGIRKGELTGRHLANGMLPGPNDELLRAFGSGCATMLTSGELINGALQKHVKPAADMHRRHIHAVKALCGIKLRPVVVVVRMVTSDLQGLRVILVAGHPVFDIRFAKGSANVAGTFIHAGAGNADVLCLQPLRGSPSEEILRDATRAAADGNEAAIAPRLLFEPLEGVHTILVLAPTAADEGQVFTFRVKAAAHVLDDEDPALPHKAGGLLRALHTAVRRAREHYRKRPVARWEKEIGGQRHTIAHGDHLGLLRRWLRKDRHHLLPRFHADRPVFCRTPKHDFDLPRPLRTVGRLHELDRPRLLRQGQRAALIRIRLWK